MYVYMIICINTYLYIHTPTDTHTHGWSFILFLTHPPSKSYLCPLSHPTLGRTKEFRLLVSFKAYSAASPQAKSECFWYLSEFIPFLMAKPYYTHYYY